jgi:predicted P-loop ATPase
MDVKQLPDQPKPGSDRTLATIANVAALMAEQGIVARYNVIKKKVEIQVPGHQGTPDNLDNVTLTGIVSMCAAHAMPTGHIGEYVNAIADQHSYNPVAEWIRSREWDGQDRLVEFYATILEQADYPSELKHVLMHKWLRSAAAAALLSGYKGRGVLTLQGSQGIGKTSWIKALVSDRALCDSVVKLDHHLDASSKDSVISAMSHWIVELGELDSSLKKDVARLKGVITADSDKLRRPYDRRDSEYPRRTVFTASVNEANFLVDTTGNSRWWTIAARGIKHEHEIDMQQLFAQVAEEVLAGKPWWLAPAEERLLDEWNERHAATSVVADTVYAWLDLDPDSTIKPTAVTPSELLRQTGIQNPTNPQAKECGALLRQLYGAPKKINGSLKWRVLLREPTTDDLLSSERSSSKRPKPKLDQDVF